MIPKVIHYCWFGNNELPQEVIKCIDSWKKYCPDYEIKRWDESNFDVNANQYTKEAAQEKKWAFISDYARLEIVYNNGGIYLDTDVELIKNLDPMLNCNCFLGMEATSSLIATGLGFGAEKGSEAVKEMLDEYEGCHFKLSKYYNDTLPCPQRNSAPFFKYGFSKDISAPADLGCATVFPPEYFCPYHRLDKVLNITKNTYSIHHYDTSWLDEDAKNFQTNFEEYKKTHSKISSFFYKQYCQCKFRFGKVTPVTLINYAAYRIQRRKFEKTGNQE